MRYLPAFCLYDLFVCVPFWLATSPQIWYDFVFFCMILFSMKGCSKNRGQANKCLFHFFVFVRFLSIFFFAGFQFFMFFSIFSVVVLISVRLIAYSITY